MEIKTANSVVDVKTLNMCLWILKSTDWWENNVACAPESITKVIAVLLNMFGYSPLVVYKWSVYFLRSCL